MTEWKEIFAESKKKPLRLQTIRQVMSRIPSYSDPYRKSRVIRLNRDISFVLLTMETQAQVLNNKGPGRVSPFTVPMMIPNMATGLAAIALGAKGTLIGRAFLYGLGAEGEKGVTRILEILQKELDLTMALCGATDLSQVNKNILL